MDKILNTAKFRENLPLILRKIGKKKKPIVVGRFGQAKAVLIDILTFSWQKKVLDYVTRLDSLSKSEIETLEVLLDKKARTALLESLSEIEKGDTVSLDDL